MQYTPSSIIDMHESNHGFKRKRRNFEDSHEWIRAAANGTLTSEMRKEMEYASESDHTSDDEPESKSNDG